MTLYPQIFPIDGKYPFRPIGIRSPVPSCEDSSNLAVKGGRRQSMRTWWSLWGLLLRASTLTSFGSCEGSSSHSLQYIYTGVSVPVQGLPWFTELGYVDGQLFVHYDSNTSKTHPRVSWIKEADKEDPQYWDRNTQRAQGAEVAFRDNIHIAMHRYNHTGGLHFVQEMCGCELREDGSKGGHWQFAYDGRDFLTFDKETLTWTAADAQAEKTKRKWDTRRDYNQYQKSYLEETCIEWLQKYLRYGNESLMRKEPPEVKVTSRAGYDNMETLICRADSFYPKDIHVVWTRDGEVWEQETLNGLVAPNSDGTYHTWISTKIDPQDKGRFQCRVDHVSWKKPLDFAVEEPASTFEWKLILGCTILRVFLLVAGIIVIWLWLKSDGASSNSGQDSAENHQDSHHANMRTDNFPETPSDTGNRYSWPLSQQAPLKFELVTGQTTIDM